jgi:hypothetical protein
MNDKDKDVWDFIWAADLEDAIEKEEAYLMYVRAELRRDELEIDRYVLKIIIMAHAVSIITLLSAAALYMR